MPEQEKCRTGFDNSGRGGLMESKTAVRSVRWRSLWTVPAIVTATAMLALAQLICLTALMAEPNAKEKDKVPPIEYVQGRIWGNMRMAGFELTGAIRTEGKGPGNKTYPIILRTKGYEMVYEFQDQPLQIRVVISPEQSIVQKRENANDKWVDVSGKARLDSILDTDITYEDLGLEFIRWENVDALGTDEIKTLKSWAFEAKPNGPSRFSKARYWISSDHGAFLRVDGYNDKGEVIKRVEVNGITRVGKAYVIKQMQISNMLPGRTTSKSRTFIDIKDTKADASPKKGGKSDDPVPVSAVAAPASTASAAAPTKVKER